MLQIKSEVERVLFDRFTEDGKEEFNYEWIQNFCNTCNACVKKCPVNAIYEKPIIFEDGSEQHIDYKKCAVPFTKQHGCTLCIKECTFFKSNYEKIESAYIKKKK